MNILIINAFGNSTSSKSNFHLFTSIIKKTLKKESINFGIENIIYTYRTPYDLDDYIFDYGLNSESKNEQINKRNFDKIDIVFIDGTEKFLPWEDKGLKLCSFIKLCKLTDKFLFACGVAMLSLIYYLATGSHNDYNFINAKGEIQSIEELYKIPNSFLKEIKKNDNFLDFVTGDIMQYHNMNKTWISVMNIGLHKQYVAEKFFERGKFVLYDFFKGKDNLIKNKNSICSNYKELRIQITKKFLSYYLTENLPIEFTAYSTLTWFPHNFNVSYKKYQFKIIGICNKGPVLIEHDNSIGCSFHPNINYRETVIILENFIKKKLSAIQGKLFNFNYDTVNINENEDSPHFFRAYKINDENRKINNKEIDENGVRPFSSEAIVNNSIAFSRLKKYRKKGKFVGLNLNNRDMIFVDNNSIIQRPISTSENLFNTTNIDFKNKNNKNINNENNNINNILTTRNTNYRRGSIKKQNEVRITRNENARISEIFKDENPKHKFRVSLTDDEIKQQFIKKGKKMEKIQANDDYLNFISRDKMEEDYMINYYKRLRKDISDKLKEINLASEFRSNKIKKIKDKKEKEKNKDKINFFNRTLKTLNNLSENSKKMVCDYSNKEEENKKNNSESIKFDFSIEPQHHGVYNKLDKKYLPETTFPILNIEKNKNRKKTHKSNYLYKKKLNEVKILDNIKPNIIDNENSLSSYKFRESHPDKWLTSTGFIV